MATKKITELTELAGSDLATTDVIAIVDIDADATKKLTIQGLGDNMTVATASYAHTASIEITKEVSSSHANTADTAAGLTGQPSIYVTNITASGVISASGGTSYFKGLDVANGSILNVGGIECDQLLYAEDTTNLFNLSANDFSFDLGEVRYVQINSTGTTFGVDTVGYHITSSGNISASGIITADTGSFSYLKGNSPIIIGEEVILQQGLTLTPIQSATATDAAFYSINGKRGEVRSQLQGAVAANTGSWTLQLRNTSISASSLIVTNVVGGAGAIITGSVVTTNVVSAQTASMNFLNTGVAAIADNAPFTASFAIF